MPTKDTTMRMAFEVSDGRTVGVVVPDDLANQILGAVHAMLMARRKDLVPVDWTLNSTWAGDGRQVCCNYPGDARYYTLDDRLSSILENGSLRIHREEFTDETDREAVAKMCAMVARGEMEVQNAD